jgi:hypothetical protein
MVVDFVIVQWGRKSTVSRKAEMVHLVEANPSECEVVGPDSAQRTLCQRRRSEANQHQAEVK